MRDSSITKDVSSSVVFSPQAEELRPGNHYLTSLSLQGDDYCAFTANMPDGTVVPLHSHSDRETFYILSGEMNLSMVLRGSS